MTNLTGDIQSAVGQRYTLRGWIEYGFKQVKNELGWHDYRLTDYKSIERWWELVFSAYLLVSLHADEFKQQQQKQAENQTAATAAPWPFCLHLDWELGSSWKSALNNLRLLLQPYWCWGLKRGIHQLMDWMDNFRILPIMQLQAA